MRLLCWDWAPFMCGEISKCCSSFCVSLIQLEKGLTKVEKCNIIKKKQSPKRDKEERKLIFDFLTAASLKPPLCICSLLDRVFWTVGL